MKRPAAAEAKGHVVAEVPKTSATLSLIAYSGPLTSAPVSVKLARDRPMARLVGSPNAPTAPDTRPKLVALLVGVRGYQNPKYDTLKFPDRDAQDFAAALEAQKGLDNGLYADVETKVVDAPNRANVIDGLYWLQHEATSRDIAVVFLSGHGIKDSRQKFWFLTRDADLSRLLSDRYFERRSRRNPSRHPGQEGAVHRRLSCGRHAGCRTERRTRT